MKPKLNTNTMKTIILTLSTALFLGNTSFANTAGKSPIYKKISKAISYPVNSTETTQKDFAIIEFTINKKGEVKILESNSSKKEIIEHVENELSLIKFNPNQYKVGNKYIYRFSFSK